MTDEVNQLLAQIDALAPQIAARSKEIAAVRNIPGDIIAALRAAGLFRVITPQHYGGMELDLPTVLDLVRRLARIDSAVGWTAMIGAGAAMTAPLLPRPILDEIYRTPDVIMGGSTQPTTKAERVPRGWRVGGRWPFASGCRHADWLAGFCFMEENGRPLSDPHATDGRPLIMGFVLPASAWEIEDSWHAAGLEGTGSHHILLKERVVSAANFLDLMHGTSCEDGPLYQAPWHMMVLLPPTAALGIAEGALDALVQLAKTGRRQLRATTAMQDSEVFRYELGHAAAEIRTARLALEAQAQLHWDHACAGSLRNDARFIEGHQVGLQVTETCRRATEACYLLGGAGTVYLDSPLQRRLRDIMVLSQHYVTQARQYAGVGAALLAEGDAKTPASEPLTVPAENPKTDNPKVARLRG
jgi:alkylation response protein AidB-like acyl-CoA dehydrogenase